MLTLDGIDRSLLNRAGLWLPKLVHTTAFAGTRPCCCPRETSSFPSGRSGTSTTSSRTSTVTSTTSTVQQKFVSGCGLCNDAKYPTEWQIDTGSMNGNVNVSCLDNSTFFTVYGSVPLGVLCQVHSVGISCGGPTWTFQVFFNAPSSVILQILGTNPSFPVAVQWNGLLPLGPGGIRETFPTDCLAIGPIVCAFNFKDAVHYPDFTGTPDSVTLTALSD